MGTSWIPRKGEILEKGGGDMTPHPPYQLCYKFCLAAVVVQEAHIKETGLRKFTSSDGKI